MSTVDADELRRLSTDEYHRLIEAGAFEDFPRIELIDGLLLRMSPRTREHENAVAWLAQWLMFGVDQERFEVRIAGSLTLEGSEPEPDLAVIPRAAPRPYHPATAALVVEVAVSSLKARSAAQAGALRAGRGRRVLGRGRRRAPDHRAPGAPRRELHRGARRSRRRADRSRAGRPARARRRRAAACCERLSGETHHYPA